MSQTKKRINSVISTLMDGDEIVFTVHGAGELRLNLAAMSQANLTRAAFHGIKQRVSDAAAIPCDTATGQSASPAEKFAAMARLVEHYNSGAAEWSPARGDGTGAARTGSTMQAFANVYWEGNLAKAEEKMEAFADKRGIDRKAALKIWAGADKIQAEIERMRVVKAPVFNADELLGEMGD
jgi:hypothetical protein